MIKFHTEVTVLDELTTLIKAEIKRQYKSIRQFSAAINIPQTTIISAIRKGVKGTAFETVVKMCSALNIKLAFNSDKYMDREKSELLDIFSELDERGKHAVKTVCSMEMLRCKNIPVMTIAQALEKKQSTSSNENA